MSRVPEDPPETDELPERALRGPAGPETDEARSPLTPLTGVGRLLAERYRLLERIGEGGMGAVVRALDIEADREVAVKVLLATDLTPARAERFRREGELAARIRHPGVVRVHAAGIGVDQRPYLVYELVEGARTLSQVLPELVLLERVELLRQVAEGLGAAHALGIVHRDVKPENVLVDVAGRARVTDFGAALQGAQARLTLSGAIVGTPAYMAPEQLRGERAAIGPATDVWALGVILYEAACGAPPFPAGTLPELFDKVGRGSYVSPSRAVPGLPSGLVRVIERCLRSDPGQRYRDGAELAAALGGVFDPSSRSSVSGTRAPPRAARGLLRAVALLSLVAAGGGLVQWLYLRPRAAQRRALEGAVAWAEGARRSAWGLGVGVGGSDLSREALESHRAAARAALELSPESARPLAGELAALDRVLALRAGEQVEITGGKPERRAPADLVADACVLKERGDGPAALRCVDLALERRSEFLPGVVLQLRLLSEHAPRRFAQACTKPATRAGPAHVLAVELLPDVAGSLALAQLGGATDRLDLPGLAEAWRAQGCDSEALRAALGAGLERAAEPWRAALKRAARTARELDLLRCLGPLVIEAGGALGPAFRAVLEERFGEALEAFLADTTRIEVGRHAVAVDEVLTYALRLPQRARPRYARLLQSLRTAHVRDREAFQLRFLVAALRCGMPTWASNLVKTVPAGALRRFLKAHPESQAARFGLMMATRLTLQERARLSLASLRYVLSGKLHDLAPIYRGELHYWYGFAFREATDPNQQETLFAAIRLARPLLEAGDERLRAGLGYYQRDPWLSDLARWQAEGLQRRGDSVGAAAAWDGLAQAQERRLKRLGSEGRYYAQGLVGLARIRWSAARAFLEAGKDTRARTLAEQARAALAADGQLDTVTEIDLMLKRLERKP